MGDLIGSSLYRLANRNVALEADLARLRAENEALRTELGEAKFTISNYRQWDRLSFDCAIADKNRDLETAKTAIAAAEAKAARLETALTLYRDAVQIDVKMEGPRFMGVNSSALKRAWEADRAALATAEAKP